MRSTACRTTAAALALTAAALAGCRGGEPAAATARHTDPHEEAAAEGHGHDEHEGEHDGVVELAPEAVRRAGIETAAAAPRPFPGHRVTTGRVGVDEDRLAHVHPRVGGRLVQVPASLGDEVAAGEVLAVVDSMELGEARARYLRERAHHEVARQQYERQRALHAERIVSEQQVLEAEAAARESAADLAAARETLLLLGLGEDEVERLAWDEPAVSRVRVRAPFAGRVVAKEATLGELVDPEHTLFTLADLATVWVWVDLYERDVAHVRSGQRVEVRVDALPGEVLRGELGYVSAELDAASRTVRARVDLANPDRRLKPGMFANVALESGGDGEAAALAVPRAAVQRHAGGAVVFVRTGAGRFERRPVEVGRTQDGWVEVLAGLAAGDEVVTEGSFLLRSQADADQLGGHHH
jgi:cobalt-zinc-cadmium efflux system membrane fusion protein